MSHKEGRGGRSGLAWTDDDVDLRQSLCGTFMGSGKEEEEEGSFFGAWDMLGKHLPNFLGGLRHWGSLESGACRYRKYSKAFAK